MTVHEEVEELPALEDTLEFFFIHSGSIEFVRNKEIHKFSFPKVKVLYNLKIATTMCLFTSR